MVGEEVVVKSGFNYKKFSLFSLVILGLLLIILGIFYGGVVFGYSKKTSSQNITNPITSILGEIRARGIVINDSQNIDDEITKEVVKRGLKEFNESYIAYVLEAMFVYKLHNPPFSSETPKINFVVDSEVYGAEVIKGVARVHKGEIDNSDMRISTTKEEIIRSMLAEDLSVFMKDSVINGKTEIEMLASKTTLATKGYLQMYEDITS